MEAANTIRAAVRRVTELRQSVVEQPALAQSLHEVKLFQARRFAGSYADLLQSEPYRPAARFFLEELYSEKDYSQRDAQFARIAGGLERLFPQQVVETAVSLARLHCLSEELDMAMAQHWQSRPDLVPVGRYVAAWRAVGQPEQRAQQLETVLVIGRELDRLTRMHGLRMMLKMMRGPARMMGLGSLQDFLEAGFDTFAAMARHDNATAFFLDTVQTREGGLFTQMFAPDVAVSGSVLAAVLGQQAR